MSYESSVLGIWSLDPTLPELDSDMEFGDDNIRNIKTALRWQFAGFAGEDAVQVNVKPSELNYLSGVTGNIQTQISGKVATEGLEATINALNVNATRLGGAFANAYARVDQYTQITDIYDFTVQPTFNGSGIATEAWVAAQDYGPEVGEWVDVQNPLTSVNSSATVAHGLAGGKPDLLLFRLVCLSDDNGYTAGDELELGTMTSSDGAPCWEGDATNITVRWRDLRLTATDGSAAPNPGVSNDWKLQAKGVKF